MGSSSSIRTEASPARIVSGEDAIRWARSLFSGGEFVVLDSETTGLGNPIDFVEVEVVSSRGEPLFDSLIKPSCRREGEKAPPSSVLAGGAQDGKGVAGAVGNAEALLEGVPRQAPAKGATKAA
jgi:hypothetical protein